MGCMYWIDVAPVRERWRALVNAVMNLRVPWNAWNFLARREAVSVSRRTLLYAVSKLQEVKVECFGRILNKLRNLRFWQQCWWGCRPPVKLSGSRRFGESWVIKQTTRAFRHAKHCSPNGIAQIVTRISLLWAVSFATELIPRFVSQTAIGYIKSSNAWD